MHPTRYPDFRTVTSVLTELVLSAPRVDQGRWQGVDVSRDPAARCYELRDACFTVDLGGVEDIGH